jgi:translation initiation factor 2 subunit 2
MAEHNFDDIDDIIDFFLDLTEKQLAIKQTKPKKNQAIHKSELAIQMSMPLENIAKYSYDDLLGHLMEMMGSVDSHIKFSIMPAQISRFGAKKTVFSNFLEICESLKRDKNHINDYLMAELGTATSEDAQGRLLIKGKFNQKNIHKVLEKYIITYVQCSMCKSLNTKLSRNTANRLYFLECMNCGSSKSVASVNKGFHATTKQDRIESRK